MVLTRQFRETVAKRVQSDARFRRALLIEAVESLLDGDLATGKVLLRDYINATLGFEALAERLGKDSKSVHRMLGPNGNPRADNIFAIIKVLQDNDDLRLQVKISKSRAA
jgi:DNA-binding phage protein